MDPSKIIIVFLLQFLFALNIFSQNDITEYKPPKLMKGFDLLLQSSPSFYSTRDKNNREHYTYGSNLNASLNYWRFTDNLLISLNPNIDGAASRSHFSGYPYPVDEEQKWETNFAFQVNGGVSYYLRKTDFYANLYLTTRNWFESGYSPRFSFESYPGIGYGRLYDASRVAQMMNFEDILLKEKIISTPLNKSTRTKLVELLDKRNDRDFISMFKDDGDIEFFSRVEDLLKDEGLLQGNPGARAILKMYQALTNNAYVYFPVYKGFQVQAESKAYSVYHSSCTPTGCRNNYTIYYFNNVMLSGIYGLPVGKKLSFLGSVFAVIPLTEKYLEEYLTYEFHSPVTLIEQNSLNSANYNVLRQSENNLREDYTKMDMGFSTTGFLSINRFCGVSANVYADFMLRNYMGDGIYGGFNTSFYFNILNHLRLRAYVNAVSSKTTNYNYIIGSDVTYYVF